MLRDFKMPEGGMVDPPDLAYEKTLQAAQGYFQLEMWEDAWNELENLAPELRHYPQVILMRLLIFNNMERWEYAVLLGKGAVQQYPQFGPLYLATAHALSRFEGAAAARTMLLSGEDALKDEPAFHFMLACYDSQLGNLDLAKTALARAFEIDEKLRLRALQDSDLKPLWESLGES
jgi:tetratricopeptide (TPR) repeat protein